jgi:hypothetical protein
MEDFRRTMLAKGYSRWWSKDFRREMLAKGEDFPQLR